MMTEIWNPYSLKGEKPFKQFDTWAEFIEHYVVPDNEILRDGGPGEARQAGEWYLTQDSSQWYLSYIGEDGWLIKIILVPLNLEQPIYPMNIAEHQGGKDDWGGNTHHYKVDIGNIWNFDFINWKDENPLEVKE